MMTMKKGLATLSAAAIALSVCAGSGHAASKGDAGTTAGTVLRLGSGGRAPAMGDAAVANARGIDGLHYNPAGLAVTSRAMVGASYQNLVLDIAHGELGYAQPINSVSSWGLSLSYLDYGKAERVSVTDIINNARTGTSFSGRDIVFGASYGRQITDAISFGATGKFVTEEIDNVSGTAFAADFGLQARPQGWPIPAKFGVSIHNLGTKMKFERVQEDLPILGRLGVEVPLLNERLTISADAEKVRDMDWTAQIGAEAKFADMLFLRAGYDGRVDADNGLTAGLGVKLSDLAIDYSYIPYGKLGNNHRLSLQYQFGPDYDYHP